MFRLNAYCAWWYNVVHDTHQLKSCTRRVYYNNVAIIFVNNYNYNNLYLMNSVSPCTLLACNNTLIIWVLHIFEIGFSQNITFRKNFILAMFFNRFHSKVEILVFRKIVYFRIVWKSENPTGLMFSEWKLSSYYSRCFPIHFIVEIHCTNITVSIL